VISKRFINLERKVAGSKIYDNFFIYIPVEVARDSSFPFKPKDKLVVKVDKSKKRVVLERAELSKMAENTLIYSCKRIF
jgi:bifunctional DNA-binding transcriptional regulator/antitoxin component of YhaV-PrlF toxin-antitoxin module